MGLQSRAVGILPQLTRCVPADREKGRVSACGANMASTIGEIIASGATLEIDLLIAVPSNSDKSGFAKPSWTGYRSQMAAASVRANTLPAGLAFRINCQFLAFWGVWQIAAVAVSYQGNLLFIAPLNATKFCTPQTPFPVEINGLINGVIA